MQSARRRMAQICAHRLVNSYVNIDLLSLSSFPTLRNRGQMLPQSANTRARNKCAQACSRKSRSLPEFGAACSLGSPLSLHCCSGGPSPSESCRGHAQAATAGPSGPRRAASRRELQRRSAAEGRCAVSCRVLDMHRGPRGNTCMLHRDGNRLWPCRHRDAHRTLGGHGSQHSVAA